MCHRRRALPEPDLLGHCSQTWPQNVGCFYPATLDYRRPDGQIRGIRWGASGRRWKRISWSLTLLLFLPGMCLWAMRCLALQQPSSDRVLTDQGQKRASGSLRASETTRPLTGAAALRVSLACPDPSSQRPEQPFLPPMPSS